MTQRSGIGKVLSFTANVTTAPKQLMATARQRIFTMSIAQNNQFVKAGRNTRAHPFYMTFWWASIRCMCVSLAVYGRAGAADTGTKEDDDDQ